MSGKKEAVETGKVRAHKESDVLPGRLVGRSAAMACRGQAAPSWALNNDPEDALLPHQCTGRSGPRLVSASVERMSSKRQHRGPLQVDPLHTDSATERGHGSYKAGARDLAVRSRGSMLTSKVATEASERQSVLQGKWRRACVVPER